MTITDIREMLDCISGIETERHFNEFSAGAWHSTLEDVPVTYARAAVRWFYLTHAGQIMPSDIRLGAVVAGWKDEL